MPRFVVFRTTSTIKDEKYAAKFHYVKTVSGNVVAHSIAFRVVLKYWQGDDPFPLATIKMRQKLGGGSAPFLGRGAGFPSSSMWL